MGKQLFIGLTTEGSTDIRFLESIVRRTFQHIAYNECKQDIDIVIQNIKFVPKKGLGFAEYVVEASKQGVEDFGCMVLAVHTDADRETYAKRIEDKFKPAQKLLDREDDSVCKIITPIIPIRMIEAWMLADKDLFRQELGTNLSFNELGINRDPEIMADPKAEIEEAIRRAFDHQSRRRRHLKISELYELLGDKISIEKLETLLSYRNFQDEVRKTYATLNYR